MLLASSVAQAVLNCMSMPATFFSLGSTECRKLREAL